MMNLRRVSATEGWPLLFNPDGSIRVTEGTIDTVLLLLNNDRLKSPINAENFDVDAKRKLV